MLVGCPEFHSEEPITANTLTACPFAGLLISTWLSFFQSKEDKSWKSTNSPLVPQKVFTLESSHITNPYLIYTLNLIKELTYTCEKIQGEPNRNITNADSTNLMFKFISLYISGCFHSVNIQTSVWLCKTMYWEAHKISEEVKDTINIDYQFQVLRSDTHDWYSPKGQWYLGRFSWSL